MVVGVVLDPSPSFLPQTVGFRFGSLPLIIQLCRLGLCRLWLEVNLIRVGLVVSDYCQVVHLGHEILFGYLVCPRTRRMLRDITGDEQPPFGVKNASQVDLS